MEIISKFDLGETFYNVCLNSLTKTYEVKSLVVNKIEIYMNESQVAVIGYRPMGVEGTLVDSIAEHDCFTWTESKGKLDELNIG